MTKKELAKSYHQQGFNCAQAVICAFAEELGVPVDLLFRMSEGFGGGMGGTGGTCGAVTAAYMALGLRNSGGTATRTKAQTYGEVRQLGTAFSQKNGSLLCREIKGENPTGTILRSCPGCVEDAVALLEDRLKR